jgi:hypothetical protein
MRKKLESTLDVTNLNVLIEGSFGRGFLGNYQYKIGVSSTGEGYRNVEVPDLIARFPNSIIFSRIAGFFGTTENYVADGSVISVLPRYSKEAKKYAELYFTQTGKKVLINFVAKSDIRNRKPRPSFKFELLKAG